MGRKNSNARQRIESRKIKVQPNFKVQVYIPSRPYRSRDDHRPGIVVAEGRVMVG
jgi:hypothetical protein